MTTCGKQQSIDRIVSTIVNHPIVIGDFHPVEMMIKAHILLHGDDIVNYMLTSYANTVILADFIHDIDVSKYTQNKIVSHGLQSENVEVRDAVIHAIEHWDDIRFVDSLKKFIVNEPIEWLRGYATQILNEFLRRKS